MSDREQAFRAWLRDRVESRGPIPFVEFMDAALYDPRFGYYCRPDADTGPSGDFYTSPDLNPAFGRLLARQIAEIADRTCGEGEPFHIVEAGPGAGRLARDILAGLTSDRPDLAARSRYVLVEISESMRRAQRLTLSGADRSGPVPVEWSSWSGLLERSWEGGFRGCVVANEFLDALPVHLVEMRGGRLREVHVTFEDGAVSELLLDPVTDRIERHLQALGVSLAEGQRAEVGLRGLDWTASLGRLLSQGAPGRAGGTGGAILVDYGHPAAQLYEPSRSRGTLLCYRGHRTCEDPYAHPGGQDMTAHVDFTSVESAARSGGLDAAGPITQMNFLVAMGLAGMLAALAASGNAGVESIRERLSLHALMAPGGMGGIFKVMLLTRGTPAGSLTGARNPFREAAGEVGWTTTA